MNSIYEIKVLNGDEEEVSLQEYEGKVMLIFNSATRCGFTKQYDELQDLYEKYAHEGFEILDFPCNQFGGQAPESHDEIVSFCDATFGIKFPIFEKIEVNGENAHPLFRFLKESQGAKKEEDEGGLAAIIRHNLSRYQTGYDAESDIRWNFTKFLVDRNGNVVKRYEPEEDLLILEEDIRALL